MLSLRCYHFWCQPSLPGQGDVCLHCKVALSFPIFIPCSLERSHVRSRIYVPLPWEKRFCLIFICAWVLSSLSHLFIFSIIYICMDSEIYFILWALIPLFILLLNCSSFGQQSSIYLLLCSFYTPTSWWVVLFWRGVFFWILPCFLATQNTPGSFWANPRIIYFFKYGSSDGEDNTIGNWYYQ